RDGVDVDPLGVGETAEVAAPRARPIERVAVRPLAVELDAVVAEPARGPDQLLECESLAAVPEAEIGDAIEADAQIRGRFRRQGARPEGCRAPSSRGCDATSLSPSDSRPDT